MVGPRDRQAVNRSEAVAPQQRAVELLSPSALSDLDTQLMLQVRAGNREAAGTLIRRNHNRIAAYIARLIGKSRSVEDLTQDVFVQALSHADRYEPTARVSTWLYRIATNVALNHMKQPSVRRHAPDPPEACFELSDRAEQTPDHQLSLDELRQQVAAAIRALPLNQRIALTLFEFEGFSYEQISIILDVTVEGVRSLLLRARTTLRCMLHGVL